MIRKRYRQRKRMKDYAWFLKKLEKELHLKIKKIPKEQREEAYRYIIISKLKEKAMDLEKMCIEKKRDTRKEDTHLEYILHKTTTLPSKIRIFETEFKRQEFKKIIRLIESIEGELKDV